MNSTVLRNLIYSSVFEIGDSTNIEANSKAVALQRSEQLFYSYELPDEEISIFFEPIPIPSLTEYVEFNRLNQSPNITVGEVNILSLSVVGIFHIGSTRHAYLESRIRHIRHLPLLTNDHLPNEKAYNIK